MTGRHKAGTVLPNPIDKLFSSILSKDQLLSLPRDELSLHYEVTLGLRRMDAVILIKPKGVDPMCLLLELKTSQSSSKNLNSDTKQMQIKCGIAQLRDSRRYIVQELKDTSSTQTVRLISVLFVVGRNFEVLLKKTLTNTLIQGSFSQLSLLILKQSDREELKRAKRCSSRFARTPLPR